MHTGQLIGIGHFCVICMIVFLTIFAIHHVPKIKRGCTDFASAGLTELQKPTHKSV